MASTAMPFPINTPPRYDASAIFFFYLEPASSYQQDDPQRQTSTSIPGIQQTQEHGQRVESGMDDLVTASEAQRRVEQHSNFPTKTSQMDGPGASQPEQISQQQKEQQHQLLQAEQEMGGASQQISHQQQQQQQWQAVQGVQQQAQAQQQQPQAARPMVVWSGIMELTEVVRFS